MASLAEMQVVSCLGGGRTRLESRSRPHPEGGEVLLRLRFCGLCGTDLFKLAADTVDRGTVLGHEVVGTVEAVGPEAQGPGGLRFSVGDRIAVPHHVPCGQCALCRRGSETMCPVFRENLLAPGGFSEYLVVRPRAVSRAARKIPTGVPDEAAAFLEPAACVLRGIRRAGLEREGTAVIAGGGSMGLLHVLVLRALSPDVRVLLVEPLAERRALAERLGADRSFEPRGASEEVAEITDRLGADAVFDTVGGRDVLDSSLGWCRDGGSVVLFAHASPGERGGIELNRLFKGERRVLGTYSSSPGEQEAIHDLLSKGELDPTPLVTGCLPLSRFDEAVERVRSRQDLKILLHPDELAGRSV